MWNDTELQHDIENEIGWELSAGLTQISVTVKSGAVELGGHVDSFWEKCAAERAAWRVAHVNHVTNGIRVVVPFNKQRDDDDIALAAMSSLEWNCLAPGTVEVQVAEGWVSVGDVKASIDAALRRNALVDSSHIKAHVAHGVASLRGTARSRAEYEEAMHAAWAAPGVTKIEDNITIGSVRKRIAESRHALSSRIYTESVTEGSATVGCLFP